MTFSNQAKLQLALAAALLCIFTAQAKAATLVWGSGTWGADTWAATVPDGGNGGTVSLPPALPGGAFKGQADPASSTAATFAIGLTRDEGLSWLTNARVGDQVKIAGFIKPEAQHIGQRADIFVVDRLNDSFRMKNQGGIFVAWDARVPNLVPFREGVTLTDNHAVDVFTGTLGIAGDHRFFIGYMTSDGILRYTPNALRLTITP